MVVATAAFSILLVALSDVSMAGLAVAEARRRGFKAVAALEPDRALVATRELAPDAVILGLDQIHRGYPAPSTALSLTEEGVEETIDLAGEGLGPDQ